MEGSLSANSLANSIGKEAQQLLGDFSRAQEWKHPADVPEHNVSKKVCQQEGAGDTVHDHISNRAILSVIIVRLIV